MTSSRDEIMNRVRAAPSNTTRASASPLPPRARVQPRVAGDADAEIDFLLAEIAKLGGAVRRVAGRDELRAALRDLVQTERVKKATLWQTRELQDLGIADALAALGVIIVPPDAGKRALAECDLGVTGADAALPETGTLVLRASAEHSQVVSLLPRVHLAIVRPAALRADLHQVLDDVKGDARVHFVTGPSRTADIEKTLAIGVHGPKALYVWVYV
ncbi:MAG: lactate utilization protein [Chloroflexota bacterium]|nr:lactate utilization protein [Chloroflexota bacterium]